MGADKVLCLITGPSGAGKTCIALELQKRLLKVTETTTFTSGSRKTFTEGYNRSGNPQSLPGNPDMKKVSSVAVIHQDHYFTKPFLPYKERVDDSFENGSGIDWDGLFSDVRSHLKEAPVNKDNGFNDGNRDDNGDSCVVVIIEGHLLGDAAHLFRKNFSDCENVGILCVLLVGCSQESCKHRRLKRKEGRSEEERNDLAKYIDDFVWPSFLNYGIAAMDTLRQELFGVAATATIRTNATVRQVHDSRLRSGAVDPNKTVSVLLEVENSESASLETNVDEIFDQINLILHDC